MYCSKLLKKKFNLKKLGSIIEKQPKLQCQAIVVFDHGSFLRWLWIIIPNVLIYNNPYECITNPAITCG